MHVLDGASVWSVVGASPPSNGPQADKSRWIETAREALVQQS